MSQGLPVVSTVVGGIPTLIQDEFTGLLVPSSDSVALAAALNRLALSPRLRQRLGEQPRALRLSPSASPNKPRVRFVELYKTSCPYGPSPH